MTNNPPKGSTSQTGGRLAAVAAGMGRSLSRPTFMSETSGSNSSQSTATMSAADFFSANVERSKVIAAAKSSMASLGDLVAAGAWRMAARVSEQMVQTGQSGESRLKPHEILQLRLTQVLCFYRLREYKDAIQIFIDLKDLDAASYQYESYPSAYPDGRRGSMVPFTLRLLRAQLPAYVGNLGQAIELLFALADWCGTQGKADASNEARWSDRLIRCKLAASSLFLRWHFPVPAIQILTELTKVRPTDLSVTLALFYTYLSSGFSERAAKALERAKAAALSPTEKAQVQVAQAVQDICNEEPDRAAEILHPLLENSSVAAVDLPVAWFQANNDVGAVHMAECWLEDDEPVPHFHPVALQNLSTMYELHSDQANDLRRKLRALAARKASEDFDPAECGLLNLGPDPTSAHPSTSSPAPVPSPSVTHPNAAVKLPRVASSVQQPL